MRSLPGTFASAYSFLRALTTATRSEGGDGLRLRAGKAGAATLLYERKGDVVSVSRTKELIAELRSGTEAHSVLGLSDG